MPKAATRSRRKRNSDDEDEDFVAKEVISKKKKKATIQKEYGTQKERGVTRKISASTAAKRCISSENPGGSQQAPIKSKPKAIGKERDRKQVAHVVFKPTSMRRDDATEEEEEDQAANPPLPKQQKLP